MNLTIVMSCLLAMGLIVIASIASLVSFARRSDGVTAGRCRDDATTIAVVAASGAASAGAIGCSAASSTSCN